MTSSFEFHLLRVTMAQLLKAHGFDKCNNRALDLVTDLYVRYFQLLLQTVTKYMEARNDIEPNIQDISDAFLELKIISPARRLDAYDSDRLVTQGLNNFEYWFQSDMNTRLREVARPNKEFLTELAELKSSMDIHTKMNSLTAALGQATPGLHRQPTQPLEPLSVPANENEPIEDGIRLDPDWIRFVLRGQLSEKPDTKFKGTILDEYVPEDLQQPTVTSNNDHVVFGPTPENLAQHLPYAENQKMDDPDDI
ncbi:hypothetical protein KL918_000319 [Ogataea parapolymorpha]|uniref:Bromodomain associated domain-containing protein n=1 Tax=Ogataea parapolymorpha (strain ATCC 26012 / BCRC 20466 / JCM 22074 / NRRL Y-7560 / DL-1) TaxID=871575 RepID=W1Q8N0_OGAPD|nr:hypothetical protein HPODL_02992 [Ogataea parapolymorpha DL-1]ESW96366.1 hypothetical protein HPODL_02992 [Ogataea parapolymorpha DL-1]KAG7870115.1 hypothetical protein KL918_000319 [Ogataea parapolymorpha]KAG7875064.1 hypothetical protein KL916_000676 [Ogataea parapolymorpha]